MRDIVVLAIVFIAIPFALRQPYIGILLWSWIGYMNPHRLGWGIAYNFPLAALVGFVTIIGVFVSKEPKRFPITPVVVVLILFNVWMLITTIFSIFPESAWIQWNKVWKIQLMTFLTLLVINNRKQVHYLVWVITMSIAFYGIKGGVFTLAHGGQFMVLGPPGSFIAGNTEIALALVMTLPLMRYLQQNTEQKWIKIALIVGMGLVGLSIVGSYSRGALLAGAAMVVFLWLKSKGRVLIGILLAVAVPIILANMPEQWFERMHTIKTYEEDASAMGRINAWWFAYNLANDKPLLGGGFGAFDKETFRIYAPEPENLHDAHSIYFEVLGEQGYVGLILFLMIGLLGWRIGTRIRKLAKDNLDLKWADDLASMIQVSLVGYAVGGAFLGLAYFDLFYHLIVILVLTEVFVKEQREIDNAQSVSNEMDTRRERRGGLVNAMRVNKE